MKYITLLILLFSCTENCHNEIIEKTKMDIYISKNLPYDTVKILTQDFGDRIKIYYIKCGINEYDDFYFNQFMYKDKVFYIRDEKSLFKKFRQMTLSHFISSKIVYAVEVGSGITRDIEFDSLNVGFLRPTSKKLDINKVNSYDE